MSPMAEESPPDLVAILREARAEAAERLSEFSATERAYADARSLRRRGSQAPRRGRRRARAGRGRLGRHLYGVWADHSRRATRRPPLGGSVRDLRGDHEPLTRRAGHAPARRI